MAIVDKFDQAIFALVHSLSSSVTNVIMGIFTYLGEAGALWITLSLIFLIVKSTRRLGMYMLICLAVTYLINDIILKNIFERPRPFIADEGIKLVIKAPSGFSFPSGHSASSFTAATAIFLYNKRWGIWALAVAFLIAISRIYFSVHYPSDVLCGITLGIICALIITKVINIIGAKITSYMDGENKNGTV